MKSALSRHLYTDPAFYKSLVAITLPIALQNVISLGVNMMDTVMLGQLGDVAIAAANLGGQPFMILNVLGFGLASGASVLIAQYWGRRDMARIRQLFTITLRGALAASALFCLGCLCFPQGILSIYTPEPEVIRAGADYLRILALSFVLYSFSNCYIMCLRAVEQVKVEHGGVRAQLFRQRLFQLVLHLRQPGLSGAGGAGRGGGHPDRPRHRVRAGGALHALCGKKGAASPRPPCSAPPAGCWAILSKTACR